MSVLAVEHLYEVLIDFEAKNLSWYEIISTVVYLLL